MIEEITGKVRGESEIRIPVHLILRGVSLLSLHVL